MGSYSTGAGAPKPSNKKVGYSNLKPVIQKLFSNAQYGTSVQNIYAQYHSGNYGEIPCSIKGLFEESEDYVKPTVLDMYMSDDQFETYLKVIKNPKTTVCGFDFYSCCFTEEQVKRSLEVLFDHEDPSLNDVSFILNFLRRVINPERMEHAREIIKETLQKIDLHPKSEADIADLSKRGFTDEQCMYFNFFVSIDFDDIFGKEFVKDCIFNILLPKAEELHKEDCLGAKYFLFFESSYSRFIDREVFSKYKDQLTSFFILHHPELYDTLELRDDVKRYLEERIKMDILGKLGMYGYPDGSVQCSIDIDLDSIHLCDSINDNVDFSKVKLEIFEYHVDDPDKPQPDIPRDIISSIL